MLDACNVVISRWLLKYGLATEVWLSHSLHKGGEAFDGFCMAFEFSLDWLRLKEKYM
jgi:hypothetical protein